MRQLFSRVYKKRGAGLSPEAQKRHRELSNVDYALYEHFNQSLWRQIQNEGESFHEELNLYRKYIARTHAYCQPMYDVLRRNKSNIRWLLFNMKPLVFSTTKFHGKFSVDPVFCALARIDIAQFYNIMKVHSFPQICDFLDPQYKDTGPNKFKIYAKTNSVELNWNYCAANPDRTLVALDAIAAALYL